MNTFKRRHNLLKWHLNVSLNKTRVKIQQTIKRWRWRILQLACSVVAANRMCLFVVNETRFKYSSFPLVLPSCFPSPTLGTFTGFHQNNLFNRGRGSTTLHKRLREAHKPDRHWGQQQTFDPTKPPAPPSGQLPHQPFHHSVRRFANGLGIVWVT